MERNSPKSKVQATSTTIILPALSPNGMKTVIKSPLQHLRMGMKLAVTQRGKKMEIN